MFPATATPKFHLPLNAFITTSPVFLTAKYSEVPVVSLNESELPTLTTLVPAPVFPFAE